MIPRIAMNALRSSIIHAGQKDSPSLKMKKAKAANKLMMSMVNLFFVILAIYRFLSETLNRLRFLGIELSFA